MRNSVILPDVHNTMQRFLTVQAAVTPTSVLPAPGERERVRESVGERSEREREEGEEEEDSPQGSTITPDLALPLPNIFLKLFSYKKKQQKIKKTL